MKRIKAYKLELAEPALWVRRADSRAVFHAIEFIEDALTDDGEMKLVHIRHKVELADPSNDVIALVGSVRTCLKSGRIEPQPPSLWYWNGQFWLQAVDKLRIPYYKLQIRQYDKKQHALYPIAIENADELLATLKSGMED